VSDNITPVLALYDFSAKQKYIYKTNKVKEIIGGDAIIGGAFEMFLRRLCGELGFVTNIDWVNLGGKRLQGNLTPFKTETFKTETFRRKSEGNDKYFEVVDIGGGNLFVLFADEDSCRAANRFFSHMMLNEACDLNVVCAYVKANLEGSFADDRKQVLAESNFLKRTVPTTYPVNVLPFTQIDRVTSMPIVYKKNSEEYSRDSLLKLQKYRELLDREEVTADQDRIFDHLITEKGKDSLLAVIYADGNGMGGKLQEFEKDIAKKNYEDSVNEYREFSARIREVFVDAGKKAVDEYVRQMNQTTGKERPWLRWIVSAGDEIAIICNAHIALDITFRYFDSVWQYNRKNCTDFSSCAGIAIFHSHDPFAVVYEFAEACCEEGKKLNRRLGNNHFFFDFHHCYGGVANDFELVRSQERSYTNRPYYYTFDEKQTDEELVNHDYAKHMGRIAEIFADAGVVRSDVKNLPERIVMGESYFETEIERLKTKYGGDQGFGVQAEDRGSVFDFASVYDLWFKKEPANEEEQHEQNKN
jgi:hypothetical protein